MNPQGHGEDGRRISSYQLQTDARIGAVAVMTYLKESNMGQYPPPYDSGPYAVDSQASHGNPYRADGPVYAPPATPPHSGPYSGGPVPNNGIQVPPHAPGGPVMPVYGPAAGMPVAYVPAVPAPMVMVPPPNPEEVAEKGRRVTRGLGLGAAITGLISVAIQVLAVLGIIWMIAASDSWRDDAAVAAAMLVLLGLFALPLLISLAWATAFGLSLAACIRANMDGAKRESGQWASSGGIMGALLTASVLQGAPFVLLFFAAVAYSDSFNQSGGNAMIVMAAIMGFALLFAHIALIIKIRGLGVSVEKEVPYA